MRRLAHLSDLHFGRHDERVVAGLEQALTEERPDLVVISGDFTQRARRSQFARARAFLDTLRAGGLGLLTIPGNHDVPLYDLARRLLVPLDRYRRYIADDLDPFVADEEVAVLGLNTARSATISHGRVNQEQMARMRVLFAGAPPGARRVLVTHHPLVDLPWGEDGRVLPAAGRAEAALGAALASGVHLLLAGHHHRPFAGSVAAFRAEHGRMLVVQAGTTTSTRLRAHANSYNLIRLDGPEVAIEVRGWDGTGFAPASHEAWTFGPDGWQAAGQVSRGRAGGAARGP